MSAFRNFAASFPSFLFPFSNWTACFLGSISTNRNTSLAGDLLTKNWSNFRNTSGRSDITSCTAQLPPTRRVLTSTTPRKIFVIRQSHTAQYTSQILNKSVHQKPDISVRPLLEQEDFEHVRVPRFLWPFRGWWRDGIFPEILCRGLRSSQSQGWPWLEFWEGPAFYLSQTNHLGRYSPLPCSDITNTLVGISGETVPEGGNLRIYWLSAATFGHGSNIWGWCVRPHSSPTRGCWPLQTILNILNIFTINIDIY